MTCQECKYSKVKSTVMPDKEIVVERHCYHNIPKTELIPNGRGLIQITYRPKVEDDDFCVEFSLKRSTSKEADDIFNYPTTEAASVKSSLIVDPS